LKDRAKDLFIGLLLAALGFTLPDLGRREGLVALGFAALLGLCAVAQTRRPAGPGAPGRLIFLGAVLFLAMQPLAKPPHDLFALPARAWVIPGVALVLWGHMNIQSVSGKLTWRFSVPDYVVLGACGVAVFGSLALMWFRADTGQVPGLILIQAAALQLAVVYLYVTRWRPDRPTFVVAALVLAALLVLGHRAGIQG